MGNQRGLYEVNVASLAPGGVEGIYGLRGPAVDGWKTQLLVEEG